MIWRILRNFADKLINNKQYETKKSFQSLPCADGRDAVGRTTSGLAAAPHPAHHDRTDGAGIFLFFRACWKNIHNGRKTIIK